MKGKQLSLNTYKGTRGGRRPNSGRKRLHSKGVAHRTRETVTSRTPLHINFKVTTFIRNKECLKHLKAAIKNARSHGLKIIHYSLQTNHVHLLVEAQDNSVLTKGMRSLLITFTKLVQKGRIQLERYHLHVLKTIRETKNALHYVLFNEQKHAKSKIVKMDDYSTVDVATARNYAKEKRLTLITAKRPVVELDLGRSFLLMSVLFCKDKVQPTFT